jgi:hypothetical protein
MARIHGRRGVVYVDLAGGGSASAVTFLNAWAISFTVANEEVTAFGDTTKTYVAGLPDASGTFAGFYDTASPQTYTAATDGLARKFYLYPDSSTATTYFFGTILIDFDVTSDVGSSVKIASKWNASTPIAKVG